MQASLYLRTEHFLAEIIKRRMVALTTAALDWGITPTAKHLDICTAAW
ncbi:MAG: hypothetical protein ACOY94_23010 [Bacillota bacterium]